jgi:excisionase family DNA binding protein
MQQDDIEMLTVEDVAKIMKVNIRTVRTWVQSGELPRIWIGKREYRISKTDLRAFTEKRKGPYPPDNRTL